MVRAADRGPCWRYGPIRRVSVVGAKAAMHWVTIRDESRLWNHTMNGSLEIRGATFHGKSFASHSGPMSTGNLSRGG